MKHIMVDLETLGTAPGSAILSIGAVEFDPYSDRIGATFDRHIDLVGSFAAGFEVSASTTLWWLTQSEDARSRIIRGQVGAQHPAGVLVDFSGFCEQVSASIKKDVVIWGNGASFDNVLLGEAYRMVNLLPPWEFWNDKCYRTIKGEYPDVKLVREGVHHDALHDAISQAKHLQSIYKSKQEKAVS